MNWELRFFFFHFLLLFVLFSEFQSLPATVATTRSQQIDRMHHPDKIDYDQFNLSKALLDQVHCVNPVEKCNKSKVLGMFPLRYSVIVNYEKKILMEFTPKAGCTYAVTMFLEEMGFHLKTHYNLFPHDFRNFYFNKRCGLVNPCLYTDPSWYRFKVVRNPFDRAVSSYIHICRFPTIAADIMDPRNVSRLSFQVFLETLTTLSSEKMENSAQTHAEYQAAAYDRYVYFHNQKYPNETIQLFHRIVKVETLKEDMEKYVNPETGSHFSPSFKGNHLAPRHNATRYFVGNIPWSELKENIPEDYGLFYNAHLKDLVTKIYHWDIVMYNYTFPYELQYL